MNTHIQLSENDPNFRDSSLLEAESAVKQSDEEVEKALGKLQEQVDSSYQKLQRLREAAKNPILLSASAFLIGTCMGQIIRNRAESRRLEKQLS